MALHYLLWPHLGVAQAGALGLREQSVGGGLRTLLAVALLLGHLEDDLLEAETAAHRLPHGLDEAPARGDNQVTYSHV